MSLLRHPAKRISVAWAYRLGITCYLLFGLGILALAYSGFVFADSHVYQALQMKKFTRASPLSEPHIPIEGEVIGEIQVPRLQLQAIVVQGDSAASLRHAVGHISKSPLPGEWGNVALVGHRDTFFRPLRNIRLGDEIQFTTAQHRFRYVVESIQIVAPDDVQVLEPSTGSDLTFVTCFPFYFVGPAPKRFIVRARELDDPAGEPVAKPGRRTQKLPQ
jgi:LPXTG-site transpeptidase (sortase) family protein